MPSIRTDIVDVYVARTVPSPGEGDDETFEFLQLLRARDPMNATWQPVMGHIEPKETAVDCAWRELKEEIGLAQDDPRLVGVWALDAVHPFYLAASDSIVMSPQFLVLMDTVFTPRLNHEHSDERWVTEVAEFMWPSQRAGVHRALEVLRSRDSLATDALRIK